MNDVKQTIAKNIAALRQAAHMTQLELAEQLNYSDKAVSKWERADATPDIVTLTEIANIFGVTLDYLVTAEHTEPKAEKKEKAKAHYNRPIVASLSIILVWFVALFSYVLVALLTEDVPGLHLIFVCAMPVSIIVWLCFNSVWFYQRLNYLIVSLLMWSVLAAVHLSLLAFGINISLIYVLGVPGQLAILLWMFMKRQSKQKPAESADET